jgi:hypothetical protein
MDRNELLVEPRNLGVPSGVSKMIYEPMVRLVQIVHLSGTNTNTVSKWTETRFHRTHVTEEFHRVHPKRFLCLWYSPHVVHLACVKISTISKQTKKSFSLSLVTKKDHWVSPKWFMSLWYIWGKPCTYLATTLRLSPNRPKQDSRWPTSPRSSIGCIKNDFWAFDTFGANRVPILHHA